jgi:succinate dehydrogenase / fumarate reductase cytochrome b subunit
MPNPRPKYLNLLQIRLPLPAFVSIVHRVTGAGLFLMIPLLLYLLQSSLESPEAFRTFKALIGQPLMKLFIIALVWAYLHHFCAGVRHLALDLHLGTELATARASSWAVLAISITLTLLFGALVW